MGWEDEWKGRRGTVREEVERREGGGWCEEDRGSGGSEDARCCLSCS